MLNDFLADNSVSIVVLGFIMSMIINFYNTYFRRRTVSDQESFVIIQKYCYLTALREGKKRPASMYGEWDRFRSIYG